LSAVLAMTTEDSRYSQAGLRALLLSWVVYRRSWNPHIGYRSAVPWIDQVDGAVGCWTSGDDYDAKIKAAEMRQVDEAVRALAPNHQNAIFVVYLNEAGPAVWRSARKPMAEIRALCEEAERLLVPALRRRDVVF
jgi:hypothetical protein